MANYTGTSRQKATKLSEWSPYANYNQENFDLADIIGAHPARTVILFGPPTEPTNPDEDTVLVGTVEQVAVTAAIPVDLRSNIGSSRRFSISDLAVYSIRLSGGVYLTDNLPVMAYHYLFKDQNLTQILSEFSNATKLAKFQGEYGSHHKFGINFNSIVTRLPFGTGIIMFDALERVIGAFWALNCKCNQFALMTQRGINLNTETLDIAVGDLKPWYEDSTVNIESQNELNRLQDQLIKKIESYVSTT